MLKEICFPLTNSILLLWVGRTYLLEYIFNKYGIKHIDIVEEMYSYFENKEDSIIGQEIRESENSLRGVFERESFGRQVLGDDDIFWEYKGGNIYCIFTKQK